MKGKISEEKLQARIEKEKLYQESISANGLKCSKCDKIKDSNNFYSYKRNAAIGKVERYSCICKECTSVERKNNYLENTDRIKSNVKNWRVRNPNKANQYYLTHREKQDRVKETNRKRTWKKHNPDKVNAGTARRRAMKKQACVSWANDNYIKLWYEHAKLEEERTGEKCHIDHVVPLQSDVVCGLHNEFNLQVLYAQDNCSKGNRYWPDMP